MAKDIKSAMSRSTGTLVSDALGAVSLMILLFFALSLPSLV